MIFMLSSCKTENKIEDKKEYLRHVGDIEQNNKIDNHDFKVCNGDINIIQYFNALQGPVYAGEKSTLLETFKTKYEPINNTNKNGFIRIRFIVNCKGEAGRFRMLQSDNEFEEIEFDKRITSQLLEITKGIENWEILFLDEIYWDYYIYLIFKINNGQLTEILP